jgi:hypothetical protein
MYVSLSSLCEYERERCSCRVNGGFTGGSAAWPRGGSSAWETNMAVTTEQRGQCAVWYAKFSSVTRTQRAFRRQYSCHHIPSHRDIVKWYMFLENGLTMPHTGGRVRDRNREEDIQSPRKSLRRLSAEKNVPYRTCQRIVRRYPNMFPYHIQ